MGETLKAQGDIKSICLWGFRGGEPLPYSYFNKYIVTQQSAHEILITSHLRNFTFFIKEMINPWHIRRAKPEDAEAFANCMTTAYTVYLDRMKGKRLPPMDVDYLSEIRDYPSWVAECNGKIAGGLIMMFEEEYASIANIAVHPDYQGQGLGGGLLKFAEAAAHSRKYSEIRLATHILLTENVSLYLHLGWTEINRDFTRVYMRKKI